MGCDHGAESLNCISHKCVLRIHHGWLIRIDLLPKLVARIRQGVRRFFIQPPGAVRLHLQRPATRVPLKRKAAR